MLRGVSLRCRWLTHSCRSLWALTGPRPRRQVTTYVPCWRFRVVRHARAAARRWLAHTRSCTHAARSPWRSRVRRRPLAPGGGLGLVAAQVLAVCRLLHRDMEDMYYTGEALQKKLENLDFQRSGRAAVRGTWARSGSHFRGLCHFSGFKPDTTRVRARSRLDEPGRTDAQHTHVTRRTMLHRTAINVTCARTRSHTRVHSAPPHITPHHATLRRTTPHHVHRLVLPSSRRTRRRGGCHRTMAPHVPATTSRPAPLRRRRAGRHLFIGCSAARKSPISKCARGQLRWARARIQLANAGLAGRVCVS